MSSHDVVYEKFKALEKSFQKAKDDGDSNKMGEIVQDITKLIKSTDGLKTRQIIDLLKESSFLMKFWTSLGFRSVNDWQCPIFDLCKDYFPEKISVLENREYLLAFGKNRSFNLGILSDGCPIEEPRLVNIPKCQKIRMTNFHTLFQTFDNRVYGCGKSQNFNVGEKKNMDVSYIAEPKMIEIGEDKHFLSMDVTDKFSVLVSTEFVYFIGNCTYALSCKRAKSISPNCVQVPYFTRGWEMMKVHANEKSTILHFNFGSEQETKLEVLGDSVADPNDFLGDFSKDPYDSIASSCKKNPICYVKLNESFPNVGITVCSVPNLMLYQPANSNYRTKLEFIVNFKRVYDAKPIAFFLNAPKNEIIVQFSEGMIAKGTLEFLKLKKDEFVTVKRDKGILDHMVGYHLFAILKEIPGTFGANMFCSSPDLANVIIQFGETDKSVKRRDIQQFLSDDKLEHRQRRISTLLEKYRNTCEVKDDITLIEICEKLEVLEKTLGQRIMEFERSDLEELDLLIDFMHKWITRRLDQYELDCKIVGCEYDSVDFVIEKIKVIEKNYMKHDGVFSDMLDKQFAYNNELQKSAIRRVNEARNCHNLNDIELRRPGDLRLMWKMIKSTNEIKCLCEVIEQYAEPIPRTIYSPRSKNEINFAFCAKKMWQMLDLYIKIIMDRMENDLDIQYSPRFPTRKFRSENVCQIIKSRIMDGDLNEFDIPTELIIVSQDNGLTEWFNSFLFSAIYPKAVQFIENNIVDLDDNDELFNYLFNRARFDDELVSPPRRREFVPDGTSPEEIVCFLTSDNKHVDIHSYLVIAHSRQISAMQRFTMTQYGFQSSSSPRKLEVKTDFNAKTVRDALTALMDIRTLFPRKMNELIEILFFFDYFMMLEAVQDTMDIIFLTATPHSVPYLLNLFESFPEDTMKRFVKYPYFLLQSKLDLSHEFILEFCAKGGLMLKWKNVDSEKENNVDKSIIVDEEQFNERFAGKFVDIDSVKQKRIRNNSSRNNSVSEYSSIRQTRLKTPSICESSPRAITEPKNISSPTTSSFYDSPQSHNNLTPLKSPSSVSEPKMIFDPIIKNASLATSPIAISQSPSSVDFPESPSCSLSTPLGKHRNGGRFIPKGTKLKKVNDILQSPEPVNPWSKNVTSPSNQGLNEPDFDKMSPSKLEDVIREEEKLAKQRKGEMKKIRHLPHIEMEDQAVIEIDRVFRQQFESEAKITVELLDEQNNEIDNEPVWGIMPGLLKR